MTDIPAGHIVLNVCKWRDCHIVNEACSDNCNTYEDVLSHLDDDTQKVYALSPMTGNTEDITEAMAMVWLELKYDYEIHWDESKLPIFVQEYDGLAAFENWFNVYKMKKPDHIGHSTMNHTDQGLKK